MLNRHGGQVRGLAGTNRARRAQLSGRRNATENASRHETKAEKHVGANEPRADEIRPFASKLAHRSGELVEAARNGRPQRRRASDSGTRAQTFHAAEARGLVSNWRYTCAEIDFKRPVSFELKRALWPPQVALHTAVRHC